MGRPRYTSSKSPLLSHACSHARCHTCTHICRESEGQAATDVNCGNVTSFWRGGSQLHRWLAGEARPSRFVRRWENVWPHYSATPAWLLSPEPTYSAVHTWTHSHISSCLMSVSVKLTASQFEHPVFFTGHPEKSTVVYDTGLLSLKTFTRW